MGSRDAHAEGPSCINVGLGLACQTMLRAAVALAVACALVAVAGCTKPPSSGAEAETRRTPPVHKPFFITVLLINERSADSTFFSSAQTADSSFAVSCEGTTIAAHSQKIINCSGSRPTRTMTGETTTSPWNGAWVYYSIGWYRCPSERCPEEGKGEAFSYDNQDNPVFEGRLTNAPNLVVKWLRDGLPSAPANSPPTKSPGPISLGFRDETGLGYQIDVWIYPYRSIGQPAYEKWTGRDGDTHATVKKEADLRATVKTPGGRMGGQLFSCVSSTGANAMVTYILESNPSSASGYHLDATRDDVAWSETPC